MSLESIAYTSSAAHGLTDHDLETLLTGARHVNTKLGISGVLLFHEGSFLQYFEGPPEGVSQVYDRVRRSPLHHDLIELMRGPIAERAFTAWSMGFTHAPKSTLLQLSNAVWKAQLQQNGTSEPTSDGFALLQHFWRTNRGQGG